MGRVMATLAALAAVAVPASAAAAPSEPLTHEGRWITDADGRVVVLHGVAVVVGGAFGTAGGPEQTAAEVGFAQADAEFLADQGFNVVRLGMFFRGFSPTPGGYEDDYLQSFVGTHRQLADEGIFTLVDFHQDQLAPEYNGRGFPSWFLIDDGLPNGQQPFPQGYFVNPALNRAYDHLWENAEGPGGVGLQDRFAAGWAEVAGEFADEDRVLGYDIFNEPWPGTQWPSCANPQGCPPGGFDQTLLTDFSNRIIDGIRTADSDHIAFYEPNLQFDVGAKTQHGQVDDPNAGFSFHNYCLGAAPGLPHLPDPVGACENVGERLVFQNAEEHSEKTGAALLLTEFGDTEDPAIHDRVADLADEFMVGWTDWAYMGSTGQIKIDNAQAPTPENIRQERLDAVVRPYPQLVSGSPSRWSFDDESKQFELAYSTAPIAGGDRFEAGSVTDVFVPESDYPDGYGAVVTGAAVTSAPGAEQLELAACAGAETVQVVVTPQPRPPAACGDPPPGACELRRHGSDGADRLTGTPFGDRLAGRGGNDRIGGRAGDDCVRGGSGDDRLGGGRGRDRVRGGGGEDRLRGRDGEADVLDCGAGDDRARADFIDLVRSCEDLDRG